MKLRHFWPALAHNPAFVLRHGAAMLAHTFRGSSVRSWLGLESERTVFERYRAIRRAEREYLPIVDEAPERGEAGVKPRSDGRLIEGPRRATGAPAGAERGRGPPRATAQGSPRGEVPRIYLSGRPAARRARRSSASASWTSFRAASFARSSFASLSFCRAFCRAH